MSRSIGARVSGTIVLSVLVASMGCGQSGPKVYPVSGKVVFKGAQGNAGQLKNSTIYLQSTSNPKVTATSEIEEDGTFVLGSTIDARPYQGLMEGTYKARLTPAEPGKRLFNRRYESFDTSKLEYAIKPGPNEITVEIEPGGR